MGGLPSGGPGRRRGRGCGGFEGGEVARSRRRRLPGRGGDQSVPRVSPVAPEAVVASSVHVRVLEEDVYRARLRGHVRRPGGALLVESRDRGRRRRRCAACRRRSSVIDPVRPMQPRSAPVPRHLSRPPAPASATYSAPSGRRTACGDCSGRATTTIRPGAGGCESSERRPRRPRLTTSSRAAQNEPCAAQLRGRGSRTARVAFEPGRRCRAAAATTGRGITWSQLVAVMPSPADRERQHVGALRRLSSPSRSSRARASRSGRPLEARARRSRGVERACRCSRR